MHALQHKLAQQIAGVTMLLLLHPLAVKAAAAAAAAAQAFAGAPAAGMLPP
jgi:hypothetical protein